MKLLTELLTAVENWSGQQPLRCCVLFGSLATGQTHAQSDVDLAIWPLEAVASLTRLRWLRDLETTLEAEVSLVFVSADLDPVLGLQIAHRGRLIFEREPGLWDHLRTQLWHSYNDSLPFRRAARRRLHEFAEEVRRGA
jgi:predicted nucleotidyltransferase